MNRLLHRREIKSRKLGKRGGEGIARVNEGGEMGEEMGIWIRKLKNLVMFGPEKLKLWRRRESNHHVFWNHLYCRRGEKKRGRSA